MSQFDFGVIDPAVETGTELAADLNAWRNALHSSHSGGVRPAYALPGTCWLDTSALPICVLKLYDGVADIPIMQFNSTTHAGGVVANAAGVTFAPVGNIAATNVQAALQELDNEKASIAYVDHWTHGPSFSGVRGTNLPIVSSAWTKATFDGERHDTAGNFDPATGRFTPQVQGYYLLTGRLQYGSSGPGLSYFASAIYVNGTSVRQGSTVRFAGSENWPEASNVTGLVYLNGTTDYAELYGYAIGTGSLYIAGGSDLISFEGFLARAA